MCLWIVLYLLKIVNKPYCLISKFYEQKSHVRVHGLVCLVVLYKL